MPPVQYQQPLRGEEPEPQVRGHRRCVRVAFIPFRGLNKSLLQYVGRVDATKYATVDAKRDHLPKPVAVLRDPPCKRVAGIRGWS
jgi:hypothetical protein